MSRCPWRVHVAGFHPPTAEPAHMVPASCALEAGHSPSIAHDTGNIDHYGDTLRIRWHSSNHAQPNIPTPAEREAYLRGQLHGYEREAAAAARALSWRRDAAGYVAFWLLLAVSVLAGRRRF